MSRTHRFKNLNRNRSFRSCGHAVEISAFSAFSLEFRLKRIPYLMNQRVKP